MPMRAPCHVLSRSLDTFRGQSFHSHAYKHAALPVDCHGRRVLVVGIGNSGVDVATEVSRVAKATHLSTRTGAWVYPKFVFGVPLDHLLSPVRALRFLLPYHIMLRLLEPILAKLIELQQGSMASWGLHPGCGPLSVHPTISQVSGVLVLRVESASRTRGCRRRTYVEPSEHEQNTISTSAGVAFAIARAGLSGVWEVARSRCRMCR